MMKKNEITIHSSAAEYLTYVADVWDYDVYEEIGAYTKPVLLIGEIRIL